MQNSNKYWLIIVLISALGFSQNLKVISYNIRYDNPNDGENKWSLRKEFLAKQIQFYEPDFVGTQEGKLHQLHYIDSTLIDYNYIGIGRDNSENQGEFSALFYNSRKFKVVKQSTFWLSETPEKISKGWDAQLERICTYGLFEELKTKKQFYVFNTHFDHVGVAARLNSAKKIIEKITEINTNNLPLILTGDFNSEPSSEAYVYLATNLNDTKTISKSPSFGPTGTFNNFEFHKPVTLLIDFIFTSKNRVEVTKHAVLSDSKDGKYPSDHLPVYAEIVLK